MRCARDVGKKERKGEGGGLYSTESCLRTIQLDTRFKGTLQQAW